MCIFGTLRPVCVCEIIKMSRATHTMLINVLFGDEHGIVSNRPLKHPNWAGREWFMSTRFSFPSARVIPPPSHYAHLFMLILC